MIDMSLARYIPLGFARDDKKERVVPRKGRLLNRGIFLYRQIEDRFSALPFMIDMSLARYIPLGGNQWGGCVIPQGHPAPGPNASYLVARRRGEIGIRMALGATRSRVVSMVLRTALLQVLMGLALGIPARCLRVTS